MFTKAIKDLYILRDKYRDDQDTVGIIDKIIFELSSGMSVVLDMLADYNRKAKDYN